MTLHWQRAMTPLHGYLIGHQVFQSLIFFRTKHNTLLFTNVEQSFRSSVLLMHRLSNYDSAGFGTKKLQENRPEFEE